MSDSLHDRAVPVEPDRGELTVIQRGWFGRTHRLVFAGTGGSLLSQFESNRFVPQRAVRASVEMIASSPMREVVRFRHADDWFVLKHETYGIPRVYYGGPFSGTSSEREFRNLQTLRSLGVPAVEPIGFGTSGVGPFHDRSFLLTREFSGATDLRDWTGDLDANGSIAQVQAALMTFATDLARLHRSRRYVWTMYAKNLLVRQSHAGGGLELALCDVPRLVHWPSRKLSVSFAVRDLGALDKWAAATFPRAARVAFLTTYLDALGDGPPLAEWCRRIEHRVNRLNHRTPFSSLRKRMQRGIRGLVRGKQEIPR